VNRSFTRGAPVSEPGPPRVRVAIAGSVRLYREGLAYSLGRQRGFEIAFATDYDSLAERLCANTADILLLDVSAPGASALVGALRDAAPGTRIVAFAIEDSDETVLAFAEAGVVAFVPRDCALSQLVETLERAARGEVLWSPRRMAMLCQRLAELASVTRTPRPHGDLTTREREIAQCIELGMSNKQIGAKLGIEVSTVKNHVHKLLEKLHVTRRGEAAAFVRGPRTVPSPSPSEARTREAIRI
jgi:two-component system nitrate/nitrite response regulator NarL